MSNVLTEAAKRLEEGWCTSSLVRNGNGERFCALGAIAAVEHGLTYSALNSLPGNLKTILENALYTTLEGSAAVRAVYDELVERGECEAGKDGEGRVNSIYRFNDRQHSVESVVEVFRAASERMRGWDY